MGEGEKRASSVGCASANASDMPTRSNTLIFLTATNLRSLVSTALNTMLLAPAPRRSTMWMSLAQI